MFSYAQSVSGRMDVCNARMFAEITNSPQVAVIINQLRRCTDKDERAQLKKRLPVFCFHATFPSGRRRIKDAVPTGLFMVDLDHVENPREIFEASRQQWGDMKPLLVHITPSGKGLRYVARIPDGMSLVDAQKEFTRRLGVVADECVKDLARCSFAPKAEDVLLLDDALFADFSRTKTDEKPNNTAQKEEENKPEKPTKNTAWAALVAVPYEEGATFQNTTYKRVAEAYWTQVYGKQPYVGIRHQALLDWTREAFRLCDMDAKRVMAVTPRLGLPDEEVARIVADTQEWLKDNFRPYMSTRLRMAISVATQKLPEQASMDDAEMLRFTLSYLRQLPPQPPAITAALEGVDEKYHMAILCGLYTVACSYADKVLYKHIDWRWRRPTLETFIVAPPASGKSIVTDKVQLMMAPLKDDDLRARDRNDAARTLNATKSANTKGDATQMFVKQLSCDITPAMLLRCSKLARKNGTNVEGRVVPAKNFMFSEEAQVVEMAVKSGSLTSAWRLNFDGGLYGAERASFTTESGLEELSFDLLLECTPRVLQSLITGREMENGTASRLLLTLLPNELGQPVPHFTPTSEKCNKAILDGVQLLRSAVGFIDLEPMREAVEAWCNERAQECRERTVDDPEQQDALRKRAAVMGMTMGVIYSLLWDDRDADGHLVPNDNISLMAVTMADYVLQVQSLVYADYSQQVQPTFAFKNDCALLRLYNELPMTFSRDDVDKLKEGKTDSYNLISKLKKRGLIIKLTPNSYKKI